MPVEGLYVKSPSASNPTLPLPAAPATKVITFSSSVLSLSLTVTVVAMAAVPEVFWFPALLTPGRSILPVPSKLTPPIFLAVANAVAVAALPVVPEPVFHISEFGVPLGGVPVPL